MARLVAEYFLFVFVSAVGVFQLAAARARLRGLLFLPRPWQSALLGLLALAAGFSWFFLSGNRNRPGVEGGQQVFLMPLAALLALIFSYAVASFQHRASPPPPQASGLESLRESSLLHTLLDKDKASVSGPKTPSGGE